MRNASLGLRLWSGMTAEGEGTIPSTEVRNEEMSRRLREAFRILRLGFIVAPIVAGLDKFFNLLTDWDKYLAPVVSDTIGIQPHTFMMIVGVIDPPRDVRLERAVVIGQVGKGVHGHIELPKPPRNPNERGANTAVCGPAIVLAKSTLETGRRRAGCSSGDGAAFPGALRGLCVNCDLRRDCTYPEPLGGYGTAMNTRKCAKRHQAGSPIGEIRRIFENMGAHD